jgi:hypothetical protein
MKRESAVRDMDIGASEKLRGALEPFCFDGTECHSVVSAELRGLENTLAATKIKDAVQARYFSSISIDTAVEQVLTLIENGELTI